MDHQTATLSVLGWSLGAAAGLQFAEKCPVQDLVLIAPFTTNEDMVKKFTGIRPGILLLDRFDNLAALSSLCEQNPGLKVTIIHGEKDALIPISMGHRLSESVPDRTEFHSVPGAGHHSVFGAARELIYAKLRQ